MGGSRDATTHSAGLSALALFIALGGDAAATSVYSSAKKLISGKQIRNGTIAERHLTRSVRTKLNQTGGPVRREPRERPERRERPARAARQVRIEPNQAPDPALGR